MPDRYYLMTAPAQADGQQLDLGALPRGIHARQTYQERIMPSGPQATGSKLTSEVLLVWGSKYSRVARRAAADLEYRFIVTVDG